MKGRLVVALLVAVCWSRMALGNGGTFNATDIYATGNLVPQWWDLS